jgi:hypothetical protein
MCARSRVGCWGVAVGRIWVVKRGREGALRFFDSLGAVEFAQFSPKMLLERDDVVVALIDVAFTVKATGVAVAEENEVHIWHFDPQGKVARFCHKADTHQHWAASRGIDAGLAAGRS